MYQGLLITHSYLRYAILILLVIVIVMAATGLARKSAFNKTDNRMSLFLFIFTHLQLLIGLILYGVSYSGGFRVQFNSQTMKDPALRYFAVEHFIMMLIAIVLITIARTGAKKLASDQAKHKRMLILNSIALIIIVATVYVAGANYNTY